MNAFRYDPFDPATQAEPYDAYRRLRDEAPVYFNEERALWALSRFDDVQRALRDWQRFSSAHGTTLTTPNDELQLRSFIASDPPRHTVLRGVLKGAFTMKTVGAMEEAVGRVVDELLGPIAGRDRVDLATELAWPLPTRVILRLLGLPEADRPELERLFVQLMTKSAAEPGAIPAHALSAAARLREYFGAALEEAPSDEGLLAILVDAVRRGEITHEEGIRSAILLLVAGFDTTANLLSNAFFLLARHPEARAELRKEPALVPAAVEEVLRCESSIQSFTRVTTESVELYDAVIPDGSRVLMLVGSANRDERRWSEAARFDIHRPPLRHVAFGEGIHHCLGALLGRLEARVALTSFLDRLPDYELDGPPTRVTAFDNRGFTSLPVAFR